MENNIENQQKVFDKLLQYHSELKNTLPILIECEEMGLPQTLIKDLLEKEEIHIKGEIYSS